MPKKEKNETAERAKATAKHSAGKHPRREKPGNTTIDFSAGPQLEAAPQKPQGAVPADGAAPVVPPKRKRAHRKKQRLGDAMRKCGLDSMKVAEKMNGLVDSLAYKGPEAKLLFDALREASRALDEARVERPGGSFVSVQLVHDVPRPLRSALPLSTSQTKKIAADDAPNGEIHTDETISAGESRDGRGEHGDDARAGDDGEASR